MKELVIKQIFAPVVQDAEAVIEESKEGPAQQTDQKQVIEMVKEQVVAEVKE